MTGEIRAARAAWVGDVAAVLGSVAIAAVLSLIYNAVAARLLGPDHYSDFAAALALATLLAVALGALSPITTMLAARYVAAGHPGKVRGLVGRLLRLVIGAGAAVLAVALLFDAPLARGLRFQSGGVVSAAVVVYVGIAAASIVRAAMRGAQRFGSYSRGVIGEAAVRLLVGAACIILTNSVVLGVLAYAAGTAVATMAGARVVRSLSDTVEPVEMSEVRAMLGPTVIVVGAMAFYQNTDVLLVKRLFEPGEAGVYGATAALARTMALLAMPLEALLIPRLTYLVERRESARRVVAELVGLFVLSAAVPLVLFGVVPEPVMRAVYGRAYADGAPLLFPLGLAMFLLFLSYVAAQALIALRRPRLVYAFAGIVVVEVALVVFAGTSLMSVALILIATRSVALSVTLYGLARGSRT